MGDILDLMRILGYKSPEERRWDAHFQQPGNMSLAGLQSFVEQNPDLANSDQVKSTLQTLTGFEQAKQAQAQAGIDQSRLSLQQQQFNANQAATQRELDQKALVENQKEGMKQYINAYGPEAANKLFTDYGQLYSLPEDVINRTQKVADVTQATKTAEEAATTGFQREVQLKDIARQNQENATLLEDQLARRRLGISAANEKQIIDYRTAKEAGQPVKPPAGWIDTGGGMLAPVPGTKAHTEAVTGVNALNNTLQLIDKYQNMATGPANLFSGKAAQDADQLQNLLAQQIAQANNPGRAPTDKDIEAAKELVPSVTGAWDREKGARKLAVLRQEFLKKQQQSYGLVKHYPGVQDYQPVLPAGFKIIGGK